jgi:uridine phosphorylase
MGIMSARIASFPWRDGRPPHVPLGPGDVAPVVLLPGDPARVEIAARLYGEATSFGQRREYRAANVMTPAGLVTLCSTGIGGPSTEIALVELAGLGAKVAIRIGGMGAISPGLPLGGLLIVEHAIGMSGAASVYGGSASATPEVVEALSDAATSLGVPHIRGTVATTDSYYRGQGRAISAGGDIVDDPLPRMRAAGAVGCDMETETVFAVGRALGLSVGAVLAVHGDRISDRWLEDYEPAQETVIRVAVEAARRLLDPSTPRRPAL